MTCNWYYCTQFIAKPKAACALRYKNLIIIIITIIIFKPTSTKPQAGKLG